MLEALIFDVDGTLAETEEVHREAFNAAFAEAGLGWHWDPALYRRLLEVTGGKERMRHFIDMAAPQRVPGDVRDEPSLADAIAALHKRKTELYNQRIDEGRVDFRPGIFALLGAARAAHVRLAIATTTSLPNVESLLRAALGPLAPHTFEVIAAGDMVARKKPAPDVYQLALERLGLAAGRCLALEDSVNGLQSAQAAGLATVVTRSAYTDGQHFAGALAEVDTLDELAGAAVGTAAEGAVILAELRRLHARG